MHIIAIRPVSGHGNVVARFDAQLTPDIRMFGLKLVQSPRAPASTRQVRTPTTLPPSPPLSRKPLPAPLR